MSLYMSHLEEIRFTLVTWHSKEAYETGNKAVYGFRNMLSCSQFLNDRHFQICLLFRDLQNALHTSESSLLILKATIWIVFGYRKLYGVRRHRAHAQAEQTLLTTNLRSRARETHAHLKCSHRDTPRTTT